MIVSDSKNSSDCQCQGIKGDTGAVGPIGLKGERGLDGMPGTSSFNGDGVSNVTSKVSTIISYNTDFFFLIEFLI